MRLTIAALLLTAVSAHAQPPPPPPPPPQPLEQKYDISLGPGVQGAPYSGEGTTTVKLTLYDGTRIERTVTARVYRDSAGRIRREQTIMGAEAITETSDAPNIVIIIDPVERVVYSLSPGDLAYRIPIPVPPPPPPPPPPGLVEDLGTRQIEGLAARGRRVKRTIPAGQIGNNRPIEITDERWESPDLKVLLFSRHHDPRTGDVEYQLTKIGRTEPSPDLFKVPANYTIVDPPGR